MNNYFCADLHLDQPSIIKFRNQFTDHKEHDLFLKENYHKVVRPKDFVNMVGDVCMSPAAIEELRTWDGIKSIYLGNHDNAEFKKRGVSLEMLQSVFEDRIYGFARKHGFWVSHCPIAEEELRGRINLHGHVHNKTIQKFGYLNLSMENINYKPISLDKIRENIKNGIIHNLNG